MTLAQQLLAHLDGERRAGLAAGALEPLLAQLMATARAAWPDIELPTTAFLAHVAACLPAGGDLAAVLAELRAGDLYLACACARGDTRALRAIESGYLAEVQASVTRMNLQGVRADDVMQALRRQLFVAADGVAPRIAEYGGRGELRAWLRISAVRAALKAVRKERHEVAVDDDVLAAMPSPGPDAELDFVKRQYRAGFKRAFLESMASLPDREQNLIRQHFLDGLSIDQLGALYRVHRSTAARWITRAQGALFERTKRVLMKQMKVSRSECDSIIRLAQSQLHITLRGVQAVK